MNLAWWLETGARECPDRTAVVDPGHAPLTYAELNSLSNRIGNTLRERFGVSENDVVLTLAGETHGHVGLMFGLWKIGAIFCPMNRTQNLSWFQHIVRVTRPRLLVVEPRFLEIAREVWPEGVVEIAEVVTMAESASPALRIAGRANADIAMINFTTGTTGPSKGVIMPHGALITSYLGGVHWSGMRSSDKLFCTMYLFHAGGLSVLLTGLVAHATVILMGEPWSSERAIDFLERYRPDWLFIMVPVMTRDLNRNPRFATLDCSNLKVHLAGEPVTPAVQKMWEDRGARTLILYGMTESMAVCVTLNSFLYGDDGRVGKGLTGAPNPEFGEVKLIDPITKDALQGAGVQGEICFRGDVRTPGYYNDPARTRESIDQEGWFHTFDLGVRNENGYFTVGGRTDDIISSGAEKLSLIEVESAILRCPLVEDAACIGVPHERFGQSPAAIIAPKEAIGEETLRDEVDAFLREHLEAWKRPRLYVKVDAVPRTLAKRSKIWPQLRGLIQGVALKAEDRVLTLGEYKARGA